MPPTWKPIYTACSKISMEALKDELSFLLERKQVKEKEILDLNARIEYLQKLTHITS